MMRPDQRLLMAHVLLQFYDADEIAGLTDAALRTQYELMSTVGENPTLSERANIMTTPQGQQVGPLKPCPFCKNKDIRIFKTVVLTGSDRKPEERVWRVRCVQCCCHIDRHTKRDALAAWEQRP